VALDEALDGLAAIDPRKVRVIELRFFAGLTVAETAQILNVSPEAAVGGGLALLKTGDRIRIDLNNRKVDVLLPPAELEARRAAWTRTWGFGCAPTPES